MLLNALVNERVAAASQKKHTTRDRILGVFNHKNIQLAFHDTPGFIKASRNGSQHQPDRIKVLFHLH
jgi:GTPase Era involved in 16S rRNA processing